MTIHSVLQLDRTPEISLRPAVLGATSLRGVVELLSCMGMPCVPRRIQNHLVTSVPNISLACHMGDRGTLRIVLAEMHAQVTPSSIYDVCRAFRNTEPVRPLLILMAGPSYATLTFACFAPSGDLRHLTFEPAAALSSDIDVLTDMIAAPGETGVALALRFVTSLDAGAVSARFFAEVRAQRDRISSAWLNIPGHLTSERDQLSLLLLCRLIFLYFLQRQGHLAGDRAYMRGRVRLWQADSSDESLYRAVLTPLFFAVLNTRPEQRCPVARALGDLPYLNGGLFERTVLERRFPELDLPNHLALDVFASLLDRFRFTAVDAADAYPGVSGVHIDPEMLGRVFEGLMGADRRGATGTFYTPPHVVDLITTRCVATYLADDATVSFDAANKLLTSGVVEGLTYPQRDAIACRLREARVLDPACGSGAFLLGALSRISYGRVSLGEDPVTVRRDVVARCLHGLDLLDDAALLCSLRLWLALADTGERVPPPLPNLDRSIRQGDALLDPLELATPRAGSDADMRAMSDRDVRSALAALRPLAAQYLDAEPEQRLALREEISHAELRLAMAWVVALNRRLQMDARDAAARAGSRDLWGDTTNDARAAEKAAVYLHQRVEDSRALIARMSNSSSLPFFSFRIHFTQQQFNVILSNPPWIRAHRWPAVVGAAIRERYEVCRNAGWPDAVRHGSRAGGQVDLAVLFLERSLGLLAPGGTLGMMLPAKFLRSLYAGGARALLQRVACVSSIDDYSLDQRAVFRADAFTVGLVAKKRAAEQGSMTQSGSTCVRVRMTRRSAEPLEFDLDATDLPVIKGDPAAPWMIAPPDIIRVLRKMQSVGAAMAQHEGLSIGRGVVTGANDVLIFREVAHKLGGLSHVRAEGYFRARKLSRSTSASRKFVAYVETSALRPLLRGTDVRAWSAVPSSRVVWTAKGDKGRGTMHPRMDSYLSRHASALGARTGMSVNAAPGSIMRISAATLGNKVVWRDIAQTLNAAAVPDLARGDDGRTCPIVPLNTTYFISTGDYDTALLLSAYMNSLPLRVFARACAERAKDAHFRFFAWTIGILPLPMSWRNETAHELRDLARSAHEAQGMSRVVQAKLDAIVSRSFGLDDDDVGALLGFDHWLSGVA